MPAEGWNSTMSNAQFSGSGRSHINKTSRFLALGLLTTFGLTGVASAQWRYSQDEDQMTSKMTSYAQAESSNSLELDFPYKGRNRGTLWVRQSQRRGTNAAIAIEQGQIICGFGEGECMSIVRFDEGPPQRFAMAHPAEAPWSFSRTLRGSSPPQRRQSGSG
jgi:hypothetical protein